MQTNKHHGHATMTDEQPGTAHGRHAPHGPGAMPDEHAAMAQAPGAMMAEHHAMALWVQPVLMVLGVWLIVG